jgi:hypothetical protein
LCAALLRQVVPPLIDTQHDIVMVRCKKKMLQRTIALGA